MKKLLVCTLLACSFNAVSETELKGNPNELRQFLQPKNKVITITQNAEIISYKDVAIVNLLVTTSDKQLANSIQKNTALRDSLSAFLNEKGIPLSHIKNSTFATSPDYGWFGDKPSSFKVANTISIRITDALGMENIAKVVDEYKEVTLVNTQYEHSLKETFLQKVKEKALNKVLVQKDFYAKKLNVTLTAVSFSDDGAYVDNGQEIIEVRGLRASIKSNSSYNEPKKTTFEKLTYSAKVSVSFQVN